MYGRNRENNIFNKYYENLMPVMEVGKIEKEFKKNYAKKINLKDECCSICLDDFKENNQFRSTICLHFFHKVCIDQWIF